MRKTLLITAVSALTVSLALPVYAVDSASMEQRVKRLERMLENPVLLQLSRRLGEQQRDIQVLQDENDRLKRKLRQFEEKMDKRYVETDERLSVLEGGKPQAALKLQKTVPVDSSAQVVTEKAAVVADTVPTVVTGNVVEEALASVSSEPVKTTAEQTTSEIVKAETAAVKETSQSDLTVNDTETETTKAPVKEDVVKDEKVVESKVIQTHSATDIEKAKYKTAFAMMRSSKYDQSIKAFEIFLSDYPQSELASNAAYWSGEGYLIKGDNQSALEAFKLIMNSYPNSPKVPDAKLRAADSLDNLGKTAEAVALYKDVINTRPHSRAAKNAQKRLERK